MNFRRDFFEEFIENVDGVVYFVDKSKLKPSRLDTIRLKLLGIPNFLLHDVFLSPTTEEKLVILGPHLPTRTLHSYVLWQG